MGNMELFSLDLNLPSITERVEQAVGTLLDLFRSNTPVVAGYSGGKDSSCVASLILLAAAQAVKEGYRPMVVVTTSDTLVENPEIAGLYRNELRKMRAFGKRNGFEVTTEIVRPSLLSTIQVKVLSGRGLPAYAGTNADCSFDTKVGPQLAWRRAFFRSMKDEGRPEPVICIGTRYDESERRRLRMLLRGDSDMAPIRNKEGEWVLSPICMWSEDDVWEFLGEAAACTFGDCYSDFEEVRRVYSNASGTSCAVVADAIASGRPRGGCGARHGCWICQQSEDKSLQNMLEFDERYAYMRGLNRLNKFIRATRYDWNRRNWVGRTIRAGHIAIEPDTWHPSMVREVARYMLQLDYDEWVRASRAGEAPRFTILPLEMMIAVDAMWSLQGMAKPFAIWADWRDINQRGVRYDIPDVPEAPAQPMPPARFIHVGNEWDDSREALEWTWLRDPFVELVAGEGCGPDLRQLRNGAWVWDIEHGARFEVDPEGAAMLADFELDRMLEMYDEGVPPGGITHGYKLYVRFGVLQLAHAQVAEHDQVLRRTAFKDRLGLTLDYDTDKLYQGAVEFHELPQEARTAWAHKATTESAQTGLPLAA